MSSRISRIRIEFVWIFVLLLCAVLLGFASVRRYRHAAILMLHLDQVDQKTSNLMFNTDHCLHSTDHSAHSPNSQMEDLASRSRTQFAAFLGLGNSSGPIIEMESEKWKPLILRHCSEDLDMPPYYAPCLTKVIPNLEYGEELVYPDFEAALPGFFNLKDAQIWLRTNYGPDTQGQTSSNKRVIVDERQGRLVFTGVRGQNLAFRNVRYSDSSLSHSWVPDSSHCLGHMTSTVMFHLHQQHLIGADRASRKQPTRLGSEEEEAQEVKEGEKEQWAGEGVLAAGDRLEVVEEAAVYLTPDNERYQHWLDHTSKPLMQSAHLISGRTRILPGSILESKQPIVRTMWRWLPHINQSQLSGANNDLHVRRLFMSCRVPYVHPYLFFRLQEMVLGAEAPRVPLSQRKVVIWYSRSGQDTSRQNHGRAILNEAEVLAAVRQLLQDRGLGERLEIHPPAQAVTDQLEYVKYLNRHVAALMGPHGGGLCNFKWLALHTLVLELMPRSWISTPLYEDAIGHGLNYWVDLLESQNSRHDMVANVSNIVAMLKAELGREPVRGPIIRYRYDWPAALDDSLSRDKSRSTYFVSMKGKCCNNAPGDRGAEGLHVLQENP
ncbi:hypothetical protein VaNZ11_009032 [Volvox africanus]|uniref:Glycosyltransferase 61 catalytic domain-containing protein n=1 Tax=Volvox africanus TaxID=51714 RepID=A0ABQ5S6P9_9CHLO|nr:hypothetical protein VaNZ11_009032 [Volvox africanus]